MFLRSLEQQLVYSLKCDDFFLLACELASCRVNLTPEVKEGGELGGDLEALRLIDTHVAGYEEVCIFRL